MKNNWELLWGERWQSLLAWLPGPQELMLQRCFSTFPLYVFVGVCHWTEDTKWSFVCNFINFSVGVLVKVRMLKPEFKKYSPIITGSICQKYFFWLARTWVQQVKQELLIVKILYCLLLPVYICPSSRVSSNSKNLKSTMECLALFPLSCVQWCFILALWSGLVPGKRSCWTNQKWKCGWRCST